MGVLGLTDPATGSLLPQRLYGDLRFSHPDNEEQSLAREWERYRAQLEQDCDITVVVCRGDRDTLAQFAAATTGIDLLVGGSGEAGYETFQNADGESVPTSAAGAPPSPAPRSPWMRRRAGAGAQHPAGPV